MQEGKAPDGSREKKIFRRTHQAYRHACHRHTPFCSSFPRSCAAPEGRMAGASKSELQEECVAARGILKNIRGICIVGAPEVQAGWPSCDAGVPSCSTFSKQTLKGLPTYSP